MPMSTTATKKEKIRFVRSDRTKGMRRLENRIFYLDQIGDALDHLQAIDTELGDHRTASEKRFARQGLGGGLGQFQKLGPALWHEDQELDPNHHPEIQKTPPPRGLCFFNIFLSLQPLGFLAAEKDRLFIRFGHYFFHHSF